MYRRQGGQSRDVGVAIRPVDRGRGRLKLEPLQQRLVLRVISESVGHGDVEHLARQPLDDVADLEVILGIAIGSEPPGSDVGPKDGDKWVVISFGDFVAEAGDIDDGTIQENRLVPGGVV